ncbi:hypothetical protein E2C01_069307 [Portunus trituberculatus]|uniref:Uncharacterized protein n=1 Tax=Portunus trituberculatus TaxID=210409 RepID=A0A5B7I097_PORTR|nr:hypothetical protein [Portunus trituberculatus]
MLESSETRRRWCHAERLAPEMTADQPKERAVTPHRAAATAAASLRSVMLVLPFYAPLGLPFTALLHILSSCDSSASLPRLVLR